ncbi:YtxH domain-containing protein [Mesobacillus maritimus]|uniref:YtxH domain-containing protein n=1 Tax=Mesobacillus maritimus TaxID=1643336 RepID=UPI00203E4AF6|nr:YtxH domain-containing protein [Mesobacillus maritimus]MCM3669799.1 YtxH domain-containing protein [Mesobacillus maritimus]
MASSKKFWLGMVLGALAGGAISLFDRETRLAVKGDFKKASNAVSYIAKHPEEFIEEVQGTVSKVKTTVEQVTEDVAFISEKVGEMKEIPPQVSEIVEDSKETIKELTEDHTQVVKV